MPGAGWWFGGLMSGVAVCVIAGLAVASRHRRPVRARVAHLVMALGMAAMFLPPAPKPGGAWAAAVSAGAGVMCLPPPGRYLMRRIRTCHLHAVTGSFAMAYMIAAPSAAMAGMAGMAGMSGAAGTSGISGMDMAPGGHLPASGGAAPWVAAALAGYFLAEAVWSGTRLGARRRAGTPGGARPPGPAQGPAPGGGTGGGIGGGIGGGTAAAGTDGVAVRWTAVTTFLLTPELGAACDMATGVAMSYMFLILI